MHFLLIFFALQKSVKGLRRQTPYLSFVCSNSNRIGQYSNTVLQASATLFTSINALVVCLLFGTKLLSENVNHNNPRLMTLESVCLSVSSSLNCRLHSPYCTNEDGAQWWYFRGVCEIACLQRAATLGNCRGDRLSRRHISSVAFETAFYLNELHNKAITKSL